MNRASFPGVETGRPPRWRIVTFLAALALAAGAFGALALPRLAVDDTPAQWREAAAVDAQTKAQRKTPRVERDCPRHNRADAASFDDPR